jgi:hypothetical protein
MDKNQLVGRFDNSTIASQPIRQDAGSNIQISEKRPTELEARLGFQDATKDHIE